MSIIKIKRSGSSGAPGSLATGELAYSYLAGTESNGGDRLYVGTGVDANTGLALDVTVIGGEYFTSKLDHTPGTLTSTSAIITDANNKIDQIKIDDLVIDGSSIVVNANSAANTNLVLQAGSTGDIVLKSTVTFESAVDFDGQVTVASINVEDLTDNRIVIAGASGEIEDDANFTFDGTTFNIGANAEFTVAVADGDTQIKGTLDVDSQATLASVNVEDLSNDRIVIVGTSGELEDDSNFTFDGTTFKVGTATNDKFRVAVNTGNVDTTGNIEADGTLGADGNFRIGSAGASNFTVASATGNTLVKGTVGIDGNTAIGANTSARVWSINSDTGAITHAGVQTTTGQLNVDNLRLDGNTISATNVNGGITLTPNGTGYVDISGTNGLVIPVGTTAEQGPSIDGAIRLNSETGQFEGYSASNWSSLGGVRSVDGLTYIIAESSPGASDDTLYFYTANSNTTNINAATLDSTSLKVKTNTASSNTTTGSLVVTGGTGISGNVNIGGSVDIDTDLNVDGGDITTNATTFNLLNTNATTVNAFGAATDINIGTGGEGGGETTIGHDLTSTGDFKVGANSFFVDAGTGDTLVGRDLTVTGDLTVNGNTTSINVTTLEVEDALIYLAANNTTTDSVDIGFAGNYYDSTDEVIKITGMFRDSGTKEWYLFDEYQDTDIDDNNIEISSNTFSKGVLNTDAVKFSNTTIALTGDVAGSVSIDQLGGGDGDTNTVITISTTVQADSVALGTDTTGDYVQSISANTATGVSVSGTGEGATVTVAGVKANTSGQLGVASYDATNFDVSAAGVVTVDTIDGGTY